MKAVFLAVAVLATAGMLFHVGSGSTQVANARLHPSPSSTSLSLPLFFEPNQGQTDSRVKFLARGAGYGLFLTADEAVLELQQPSRVETQLAASPSAPTPSSSTVIRMHLDGANSAARVYGTQPLPGKSSYFIGNDPAQWHRDIPQFARVEFQGVYPGIDLVYYGEQQQLEYDFRVAPGAEPNQIALTFQGASPHLDSGDLVLSTAGGDLRFHAPHIYQPGAGPDKTIAGSFRLLAVNKIGFTVGPYDHSRELVIDPLLSYSTYFGGNVTESLVNVAVDASESIYVAGSTTSSIFPLVNPLTCCGVLGGAQNIFIAKINPSLAGSAQLLYATYLGGNGTDSLAGLAVDPNNGSPNIYVAGYTTSNNFPFTANAFQTTATFTGSQTHGFLSKLSPSSGSYQLNYSTYLSGSDTNAVFGDAVSGLAVDSLQNAYLTGVTDSNSNQSNGFPANPNGYQRSTNSPGNKQFFASVINTTGSGPQSVIYSTYFGGGNFGGNAAVVNGGGIAVDASGDLYFTGTTNMLSVTGPNGEVAFPVVNAYQGCLNNNCTVPDSSHTDAILVKINPSPRQPQAAPLLATYLGGSQNDVGIAVAVDTSSNAYVTGSTNSPTTGAADWNCVSPCIVGLQGTYGGGGDAFIAKVGNQVQSGSIFPLNFFTYIGGPGTESGQAIVVDSVGSAHVAGSTTGGLVTLNAITPSPGSSYDGSVFGGGASDAFVALIATSTISTGDYLTYLGGGGADSGTGIALDLNNTAYVAGTTQSSASSPPAFPTLNPEQGQLNGTQNAFVSKLGANSVLKVTAATGSPAPNPVPAGTQATFTFDLTNSGTDPAANVQFEAIVPTTGVASVPTAIANSGGTCTPAQGAIILCDIGPLAVNSVATVQVNVTPSIPVNPQNPQVSVSGAGAANGSALGEPVGQQDGIVDFTIAAANSGQTVKAGDVASFPVILTPQPTYNANITMSQSSSPAIVTATTPTFTNPTVTLGGTTVGTTTLNIQTVARPVNTGSLLRRPSFFATWLPIGGLSLVGLSIGAGRKRRRWLAGAVLGLIVGIIMLLPSCSSSSTPASAPGGTAAGQYTITITGSSSGSASHNTIVTLNVT